MLQQNISHIIKSSEIYANGQTLQTFIFTFLSGICNFKPVALFTNSMKKCINIWKCWQGLDRGSTHFSLEKCWWTNWLSRCLPLPCFNKFVLIQKILIVFFVTKQYQLFCVRTGGDALMKLPRFGLLPGIEAGLCYLRKWRRGES